MVKIHRDIAGQSVGPGKACNKELGRAFHRLGVSSLRITLIERGFDYRVPVREFRTEFIVALRTSFFIPSFSYAIQRAYEATCRPRPKSALGRLERLGGNA
jgi:hypothetical protein